MESLILFKRCFKCEESLAEREVLVVKKRGIATLLVSGVKLKKTDHQLLLKITVHTSCQKNYKNEKLILACLRRDRDTPYNCAQTYRPSFDFNNWRFLCEGEVTEEYRQKLTKLPQKSRNPVFNVTLQVVANTIYSYAKQRGYDWG